jgi:hypothetical protein
MALTYLNSEMIDEPAKFDQLYVTSLTALTATIQNTLTNDLTSFNVTDSSIISVNSVNDALRITQTGTGNVLVVEDSENPDSTPFIIKNDGKVGIGFSTPAAELDVRGTIRSTSNFGTNFIVQGNGNVGINLQSPTVALDVNGDAKISGTGEFNSIKTNSVVLPVAGGGSVINDAIFLGNVTFLGGVSALSGLTVTSSSTTQSSALSVINASLETALYVNQLVPNLSGVAVFIGSGTEVLRINNPSPNPNNDPLVVVGGELSAGSGTSTNWNNVYSTVRAVSSVWGTGGQTFTTVSQASGNWQSTYTTVRTNSANWNAGGQTFTTVSQNSSDWIGGNRAYTTVSQNSGNWQSTYSLMQANSATLVSLSAANLIKFTYTPTTTATVFSVAGITPTTNSTNYRVDINGVLQEPDRDYAISGTNIVMTSPVAAGDKVVIVANTPIDIVDITTPTTLAKFSYILSAQETTFPIPGLTNPTSDPAYYRVDINGVLQEPGVDYTINGANIIITSPTASGDKVVIVANTPINIIEVQSVNTEVRTLTSNWQSTYTEVQSNSANWTDTYTIVQSNSAFWEESEDITNLSVQITGLSNEFQNLNTYIQSNSASWEESEDITNLSVQITGLSSEFQLLNTYIQSNSAFWEESEDILPTVTNYLSTSNILISSVSVAGPINITNNVSVTGNISCTDVISTSALSLSSITFTNEFTTATTLTADATVLKILLNGVPKYIQLYDID